MRYRNENFFRSRSIASSSWLIFPSTHHKCEPCIAESNQIWWPSRAPIVSGRLENRSDAFFRGSNLAEVPARREHICLSHAPCIGNLKVEADMIDRELCGWMGGVVIGTHLCHKSWIKTWHNVPKMGIAFLKQQVYGVLIRRSQYMSSNLLHNLTILLAFTQQPYSPSI